MNTTNRPSRLRFIFLAALVTVALATLPRAQAATNLLKGYIGASVGHADLRTTDSGLFGSAGSGTFELGHTGYQLSAGVRALGVLGAEVDYFDLGSGGASASWSGAGTLSNSHLSQRGEAAFAMLYLPLPFIDIYVKAGAARLRTELSATLTTPSCPPGFACPLNEVCTVNGCPPTTTSVNGSIARTDTNFAAGAGVQWKLGDFAIRGEYERFGAPGAHPDLVSVGVTWSFL